MLEGLSLWTNLGLFAVAAGLVWFAGTRIVHHADTISEATGIGQATIGLLLLGGITSLPEIAATTTAAWFGNVPLAVNNLFGGIALQVAILAVVDAAIGSRALTSELPDASVLLQGVLNVLLLALAVAGIVTGDIAVLGIGLWSYACLFAYLGAVWMLSRPETRPPWRPERREAAPQRSDVGKERSGAEAAIARGANLRIVVTKTAGLAFIILLAGYVLARTGEAISHQTGLGSSFVGFVLLSASTSLPELSSTLSAARLGKYTMAISDVLGTNLLHVGHLCILDAVAGGEPVLNRVGPFASFGALLGIAVTALFLVGMLERRNRTVLRMGYDSVAVLIVYCGGLILLYQLR